MEPAAKSHTSAAIAATATRFWSLLAGFHWATVHRPRRGRAGRLSRNV